MENDMSGHAPCGRALAAIALIIVLGLLAGYLKT